VNIAAAANANPRREIMGTCSDVRRRAFAGSANASP
jgi:hypothetical protein